MNSAVTLFVFLLLLSGGLAGFAGWTGYRLWPADRRQNYLRLLIEFAVKGIAIPFVIWAVLNTGWLVQPYMPSIQQAQNSGSPWGPPIVRVLAAGLFVICSYWAALALGWTVLTASRGLEDDARRTFRALCWTCVLGLCLPAGIMLLVGGWIMLGMSAALILIPIAGYAPSVLQPPKTAPSYARAIARIKFGKYSEAEWEIIHELESCEDDFEGWLLLAELYATRFEDLAEAERTILETCEQPSITPSQFSVALHRLADWYLRLGSNPDAARRALHMIIARYPGSHLARMAQLRINQLPKTHQECLDQKTSFSVPLPALGDSLDEPEHHSPTDTVHATEVANDCVARLKADPNDVAAREKLARMATEHLGQWQLGIDQVKLLLEMPGQPDTKRAEWLSWLAAWHLKYAHDPESGRLLLEQLAQDYPDSPQAFAARYRLRKLKGQAPAALKS